MLASLMFAVLASAQTRGSRAGDAPLIASTNFSSAHFEFEPPEAEVGKPVELVLFIPHDAGERVTFDATALDADTAWVVLAGPNATTAPEEYGDGRAITRITWQVASLEAGERDAPSIEVKLAAKSEAPHSVLVTAAKLNVRSVLGANEDSPRAPLGFRPVPPEQASRAWIAWTIGSVALLAIGAAGLALWIAKRRRAKPAPQPSRLDMIEALGRRDVEQPAAVREIHYELARLVREVFDSRHGVSRNALTDEEWLTTVAASFTPEHLQELAEILRTSAEVKYGAAQPTQWAVRETIQRARKVVSTGTILPADAGAAA